jgi:hypothetical protein
MSGATTLAPTTPTSRRLAGITVATVNGSSIPVVEFAWDPGSVERETMTSLSGVDGYAEKPVAPYMSGKFRDSQAVSVTGFVGMYNATVVFQLANGKQIVGHNMWFVGRPGVSGADAGFDFRFEGVGGTVAELNAA